MTLEFNEIGLNELDEGYAGASKFRNGELPVVAELESSMTGLDAGALVVVNGYGVDVMLTAGSDQANYRLDMDGCGNGEQVPNLTLGAGLAIANAIDITELKALVDTAAYTNSVEHRIPVTLERLGFTRTS